MNTLQKFAGASSLVTVMLTMAHAQSPHIETIPWQFNSSVEIKGLLTLNNTTGALFNYSGVPGIRMEWNPGKKAFRAGQVTGTTWDTGNIGLNSFAAGYNTLAFGTGANAFGWNAIARANSTFAAGNWPDAEGWASAAFGDGTISQGQYSLATGHVTQAVGDGSLATGYFTVANGLYATSMGFYTSAQAYGSLVIGRYNVIEGTAGSWQSADPVFAIGIGSGSAPTLQRNAFTVYKSGKVTMIKQGDILMGEFGNPGD